MRLEDVVGAAHYSPGHRPDITILDAGGVGSHTLVEVTVFRPTAPTYHRPTLRRVPGEALQARQEQRRRDYGDVGPHRLVVFAIADYGQLSTDAARVLQECVEAREDRLDVEEEHATWACRSFSSFWRQRLSVVLATGVATCILRQAQRDWRLAW